MVPSVAARMILVFGGELGGALVFVAARMVLVFEGKLGGVLVFEEELDEAGVGHSSGFPSSLQKVLLPQRPA